MNPPSARSAHALSLKHPPFGMRDYLVCSPEYGTVIPVLDDGSGPMEYGCDVVLIRTNLGPTQARVAAVTLWRRGKVPCRYLWDSENPFTGVTVQPYRIDTDEEEFWIWERA